MSAEAAHPNVGRTCLACRAPLDPEASEGLCAGCLLGRALAFSDAAADEEETDLDLIAATELEGRTLGDYEILSTLARGGMGIVFRARQRTTRRIVALKVISSGELATPKMVQRFHNEAQAAARLDHPHIVPIYEVGGDHGWHYFSMPLVEGPTLADVLRRRRPAPCVAVALLVKIARAVEHAHQRGILHRDLKPTNILLDAQGEPHLTDFGLAKVLEQDTELTLTHAVLGTPAYMSPEQAQGRNRDITTATDVYGLGAMLYELLTGRPPFLAESAPALLRKIVEEDVAPLAKARGAGDHSPVTLGQRASTGHRSRSRPAPDHAAPASERATLNAEPAGAPDRDLEVICLKCLEKDPAKRYATAGELADELDRWQRDEPILARPASVWERSFKWIRRNPARAGLALTLVIAPALLTAASLWFNVRLNRARAEAERHAAEAQLRLVSKHLHDAAQAMAAGDGFMGALTLGAAAEHVANDPESLRQIKQRLDLAFRFTPRLLRLWAAGGTPVQLQFDPAATRLIVTRRDGTARAWDLPANREITHPSAAPTALWSTASPDGRRVLELTPTPPFARLWDVERQVVEPFPQPDAPQTAAFSSDGRRVALAGNSLRVLRVVDGALLCETPAHVAPVAWIGFGSDERQVLSVDTDGKPRLWDAQTGTEEAAGLPDRIDVSVVPQFGPGGRQLFFHDGKMLRLADLVARTNAAVWEPTGPPYALAFAPDGTRLGFAGFLDQAMVWRTDTLIMEGTPQAHESGANRILFSPDGVMLATTGFDYQLRLVDRTHRRLLAPVFHHHALVEAMAFSPGARLLAVGDAEGLIRVWDLSRPALRLVTPGRLGRRTSLSPDGRWLGLVDDQARLWLTDVEKQEAVGGPLTGPAGASNVVFSSSGRLVTVTGGSGRLPIWEVPSGVVRASLPITPTALGAAFSPDERLLVATTLDGEVQRWDLARSARLEPVGHHGEQPGLVAWGPDGRWIASAHLSLQVWDAATGRRLGNPVRHADQVDAIRFNPAGDRVAAAFANHAIEPSTARLYELPAFQEVAPSLRHGDGVSEVRFSPDGRLVVTGGEDNVVQLWQATTGEPFGPALRHAGIVNSVGFDATGQLMATGAQDGLLRLWDVRRGELMAPPVAFGLLVRPVAFSASGRTLLAGNYQRQAWLINLGEQEEASAVWEQLAICATGRRMDADGDWTSLSPAEVEDLFAALAHARPELVDWPKDSRRWHEENEAVAVAAGDQAAAAFHRRWLANRPQQ